MTTMSDCGCNSGRGTHGQDRRAAHHHGCERPFCRRRDGDGHARAFPVDPNKALTQVVLPTTSGGALHVFDVAPGTSTGAGQVNQQVLPAPMTTSTLTPTYDRYDSGAR
jgi:hypothetical protein